MHTTLMCSLAILVIACGSKESAPAPSTGSQSAPVQPTPTGSAGSAAGSAAPAPSPDAGAGTVTPTNDANDVARLVVRAVASKALGSQTIDPACVVVSVVPAGDWTVAAAWLQGCGDKTARSLLWLYKRQTGAWNEDYAGTPPKCWKGVPPDIARAVAIATKIPTC